MGRGERVAFLVLACAALGYVIARAVLVPMVHDECASVLWFVQPGEWLPDRSHPDANNHFLSTGIGVFLYRAFGQGVLVLRAGSILAFVLYAWGAWRLGERLADRRVRWCFWSAILLCPFVLDFFSMFRGYGLALAGCMVAWDGMARYSVDPRPTSLFRSLSGCFLGGAAIVALVPLWGISLLLLVVMLLRHAGALPRGRVIYHLAMIIILGVAPLALATGVSLDMREQGLLYHGSLEGFTPVTVASLARYVLGSDGRPVSWVITAGAVLIALLAGTEWWRKGWTSSPVALFAVLLWADVLARIVLALGMGVNYPEDRAGIHFVPLFLVAIATCVDRLARRTPALGWMCVPLLFFPARVVWTANVDHCALWPEQCVPDRFLRSIAEETRVSGRPPLVGAYHQSALSIPFAARAFGLEPPSVQTVDFPEGAHDLRIVDRRFLRASMAGFDVVDKAEGPGLWLLRGSGQEEPVMVSRHRVDAWEGRDEFHDLARMDTALLHAGTTWVEVSVPLAFDGSSPDINVVLQVSDRSGKDLRYDALQPCVIRPAWNGETLDFRRSIPAMPSAARGVVYLYDPQRLPVRIGEGTVTFRSGAPTVRPTQGKGSSVTR